MNRRIFQRKKNDNCEPLIIRLVHSYDNGDRGKLNQAGRPQYKQKTLNFTHPSRNVKTLLTSGAPRWKKICVSFSFLECFSSRGPLFIAECPVFFTGKGRPYPGGGLCHTKYEYCMCGLRKKKRSKEICGWWGVSNCHC